MFLWWRRMVKQKLGPQCWIDAVSDISRSSKPICRSVLFISAFIHYFIQMFIKCFSAAYHLLDMNMFSSLKCRKERESSCCTDSQERFFFFFVCYHNESASTSRRWCVRRRNKTAKGKLRIICFARSFWRLLMKFNSWNRLGFKNTELKVVLKLSGHENNFITEQPYHVQLQCTTLVHALACPGGDAVMRHYLWR